MAVHTLKVQLHRLPCMYGEREGEVMRLIYPPLFTFTSAVNTFCVEEWYAPETLLDTVPSVARMKALLS